MKQGARIVVDFVRRLLNKRRGKTRYGNAFRDIPTEKTVVVFIRAALPRRIGIAVKEFRPRLL